MLSLSTIFFLISGSILAVVHALALEASLYWQYPWFDIPMHVLGGVVFVSGFATLRDIGVLKNPRLFKLGSVLFIALLVALAWEVLGVVMEQRFKPDFLSDTIIDLLMGLCGAFLGFIAIRAFSKLEV